MNVKQTSASNLAVVGQVGKTPSATIVQTGTLNSISISQASSSKASALTIQFGSAD